MLKQLLDSAGLDVHVSAELLGISPKIFQEWVTGQRAIPESMVRRLSTVLGVSRGTLRSQGKLKGQRADIAPAIWYKFRGQQLTDADRESVLLIRDLGYCVNQLEEATKTRVVEWQLLFEAIRRETDKQAPPREQGRQAARIFRQSTGLGSGNAGIGETFRYYLRSKGMVLIESPIPESNLEGCCFYLGAAPADRPCLFSNSYKRTWFRANHVLLHELAHAIFDAYTEGASIDLLSGGDLNSSLSEQRAEAFAQGCLVPREVLIHMSSTLGLDWPSLSSKDLAKLVARTHAEQKTVLLSAIENELISQEQADVYGAFDIAEDLREISERALTAKEFLERTGKKPEWQGKRSTTLSSRSLRLPSGYIKRVLDAVTGGQISPSKGAELLMIDESTFYERFGDKLPQYAE